MHRKNWFRDLLSQPFIWFLFVPLLIFDIFLEIYHRICFPLYRMPYVKRRKYIRVDRYKLKFLPWRNKLGCLYCGYANGLIHYASEIGAKTECYWCPMKHKIGKGFIPQKHHKNFAKFGDKKGFEKKYQR